MDLDKFLVDVNSFGLVCVLIPTFIYAVFDFCILEGI